MHTYIINSKVVTKKEWTTAFLKNLDATVILRTQRLPETYRPDDTGTPVSPERIREIKESYEKERQRRHNQLYKSE